ncbi:MAG: hypothetical protein AAGF93_13855 [Cyanobacteria bacterium P01_H01_bin.105]
MNFNRFRHSSQWQRWLTGVAGFCFGILLTAITDAVATQSVTVLIVVAGITLLAWIASQLIQKPEGIGVLIRSPQTIRNLKEEKDYGRHGFIGFVPIYRPSSGSPSQALSPEERQLAIQNADLDSLCFEQSNLEPTIRAICAHRHHLKYCWLLATVGDTAAGSLPYAPLLAKYLKERQGLTCNFYYGDNGYTISLDDDALVLSKTYDIVKKIFTEIQQVHRLKPKDVVADISTGFRSMTLGMVLACLDKEHDIEFMGTHYDELGAPIRGDLTPIIFSFEPDVKNG